ncbi:MAG: FHIPEP family type III secretion protein, partial [Bacteroidota bacterium]
FGDRPKPLALAAGALLLVGFLPGFPLFPFAVLSLSAGAMAFFRQKNIQESADKKMREEMAEAEKAQKPEEQPVEDLLRVDPVEIELGYSLIVLVDESRGGDVFKRITNVRRQLAQELGIILPPVRVRDNLQLDPEEYVIKIRSNEIARNILHPKMLLAMNPGTAEGELNGISVTEPVFGLPATWINTSERENAEIMGYTVVEAATVLTTHLTELLRRNANKLLTRQDVNHLIDNMKQDYPSLVEEISPDNLPVSTLQKVLQNLLKENIPVRDLPIITESLLEYYKITQNVDVLTEYVRHNLSETIKKLYEDQNGVIHAIALDPQVEDIITNALQQSSTTAIAPSLGLAPEIIQNLHKSLSEAIDDVTMAGYLPVLICAAQVRPYLYRMINTAFPMVNIISYTELPPDTDIEIQSSVKI